MRNLTFLLTVFITTMSFAQWTEDYDVNTLVADAPSGDIQSVGTNDGKTYVIFWDESDGYELRVQLLDADGNQLFGSNGILANDIADNGSWTATRSQTVDADGNLYIGFTATNDGDGYVNKISPTGEQLFGVSGITIPEGWDVKLLPQEDGGVIVGWLGTGKGMLMKYDASGNAVWDNPIQLDSPDTGSPFTAVGELAGLSDGSFIALIHTKPTSWSVNSILWAQRYDANGDAMWGSAIQISTQTTMSNRRYPILQDGDVTYLGYHGSTGWRFDSFLQRINPDGTLPWGADGSNFSTDDEYLEMTTSIAFDEDSSYIWSAANICNTNQSEYGQSVQKFDKESGEPLLDASGKVIFPVSADNWVSVGDLQLVNDKPLFLFSNGISNGVNSIQLGVVFLDENGDFEWEDEYRFIATSTGNKGRFDFTQNMAGQSIAVWTEERGGTSKAYAQNIVVEDGIFGVSDLNSFSISMYPNPTSGMIFINSEKLLSKIEIFGLSGQILKQTKNSKSIDISSLPSGVYVIKVTANDGSIKTSKVIRK